MDDPKIGQNCELSLLHPLLYKINKRLPKNFSCSFRITLRTATRCTSLR